MGSAWIGVNVFQGIWLAVLPRCVQKTRDQCHQRSKTSRSCRISGGYVFLADRTLVTVELLSWLSSVCPPLRCKIGPRLLLITNKKSHTGFQMTYKSLTLDNLKGHWQPVRMAILATAGLIVYLPLPVVTLAGQLRRRL